MLCGRGTIVSFCDGGGVTVVVAVVWLSLLLEQAATSNNPTVVRMSAEYHFVNFSIIIPPVVFIVEGAQLMI
jgi:hypothetical protein